MRTYYRDDEVHITSTTIVVCGRQYPLADLDRVWRGGGSIAGKAIGMGLGVVLVAGLFRAITSYTWWFGGLGGYIRRWATAGTGALTLLAVGMVAMAVSSLVAFEAALRGVEHIRGHGRHRELWASIYGFNVLLVRTNDSDRFERIRRALIRALDARP